MPASTDSLIPTQAIFRAPGERARLVTVRHTDGLFAQKKSWLSPHHKNYYLLMLLTQGSGRHWVDMVPYEFAADTLFFSTPEQVHAKEDVKTSGLVICFTPEFFTLAPNADLLKLPFIQPPLLERFPIRCTERAAGFSPAVRSSAKSVVRFGSGQPAKSRQPAPNRLYTDQEIALGHLLKPTADELTELRRLGHHIVREYEQPADLQDELLYAHLRVLLLYLGRLHQQRHGRAAPEPRPSLYHRLQACIEAHYKTRHDVQSYAELLHLSASHLNASVKAHSGKTVLRHLHERQLLEAKRLLYNTELSAKEIAFDLGFRDASYFTRFFKRLAGVTPLDYRAARE